MDLTRRFVFRGNASAIAGQIFRPKTIIVDVKGASSLGVSGGRSESQIAGNPNGEIIRFASGYTLATGLFDDEKQAATVTDHKGRQSSLTSTTTVTAETREVSVGLKTIVTLKRVRGTLISRSPRIGSGEPSIAPAPDTVVQGVSIGGNTLIVDLNVKFFQRYDTRAKVLAAADDPKCFGSFGNHFVSSATVEGQSQGGLVQRDGVIYATIVKQLRWEGKPPRNARIDGHTVIVDDFGTVYFGELLISKHDRRLTMVRFELGSPVGGYADVGDVVTNGSGYP